MQRIHLVFKTHLDVGFTDYARNVIANYIERDIPRALELADRLRQSGSPDRFVWTTGSWLISEYLRQAPDEKRHRLERAIAAGDIAWHALPFTTHSELMDPGLFRFGLGLAQELDARFGKQTIAAKMTDVPGHTIGIVSLLADAGVRFLHIGINPASSVPEVPPVFRWRSESGAEVVTMVHGGTYGDLMQVPGLDSAICFAHTNDNLGPQTLEEIQEIYAALRARFPGAEIFASTMDAFAHELMSVREQLPVVSQEIGDTWIHGVGSDPTKVSQFRELLRLRTSWLETGQVQPDSEAFERFQRFLLLVPEHTWGMDEKTHLADYAAYARSQFMQARGQENFRKFEASWKEQRDFIRQAVEALPSELAVQARSALGAIRPERPALDGYTLMADPAALFETAFYELQFDPGSGAVVRLKNRHTGRVWASPHHPLGLFRYEVFSHLDYERFYRQYIGNKPEVAQWAIPDFTKPGMERAGVMRGEWQAEGVRLFWKEDGEEERFLLRLAAPETASREHGCPAELWVEWRFSRRQPAARVELQWFDKPANRLPEALWFSFSPARCRPRGWRLWKLGQQISPYDVVRSGGRHLHAVSPGVRYLDEASGLTIDTLDAPLVAPGARSLLNFTNRQPPLSGGMHFLLYNNIWGTNFPMWFEEDARFRFDLSEYSPG